MRTCSFAILLAVLCVTASNAAQMPVMPVGTILEERRFNEDLAVVIPDRLELYCELSDSAEKSNAFAGFETEWRGPIEFEVSGSGSYEELGIFSTVAISLDYGGQDGWIERSFFGLGLIPDSRLNHRPSWGVTEHGKFIMRGNIIHAKPEQQRVVIDPAKYAPAGWDGRLWIGLINHDVGSSTYLMARVVNALPAGGVVGPVRDRDAKWQLKKEHQRAYLQRKPESLTQPIKRISRAVPAEMIPYARRIEATANFTEIPVEIGKVIREAGDTILPADRFSRLVSAHQSWVRDIESVRREADEAPDKLSGFLRSWRNSGSFGSEIGCVIRTASNLEKVGLTDVETGRIVRQTAEPIRISAARREHEGFQIVLSPLPGAARKVDVSVTDLRGAAGSISSSNIKINPVGYVRITPLDGREIIVADPLLIGAIPDLEPGENQPVWISVRVPDDAPAGEYSGNVMIAARGSRPLSIPLTLTVRDFEIPKQISLRSSFWLFRDQLNRFYHLDEIELEDYLKWVDFTLEYRLCPVDVFEGRCGPLVNVVGEGNKPNPAPDFTAWDRFIDRMVAGGASTIHLGQSHHQGAWFADRENPVASPGQIERLVENLKILREHYKKRGVYDLHYMQLRDETNEPSSLDVYHGVNERLPDVKLTLTVPSSEIRSFLQIPVPITPGFDADWRDEIKAKGGEYWWYVCLGPRDPFANWMTHQAAPQHRALFWQTWKNEVEGILYWGVNFWSWYGYEWPEGNNMPRHRLPPPDAPRFDNNTRYPGDGVLMYPGPSPSEPMSCIRLEIIRDGGEDFEYLLLLDRLIAEAEDSGYSGAALREAKAARAAARRLVPDLTNHEKSPEPYLMVRDRVAEAIKGLLHR